MKKLVLFFLFITSVIYAQPPIAQPSDLSVCDFNENGLGTFDLTVNNDQILNGLNASLYDVKFYATLSDAIADNNFVIMPATYSSNSNLETIYIRVEEIGNSANYATANFNLIVNPLPVFELNDVTACEGSIVELNSGLSGSYVFQWFYNNVSIAGATASSLVVTQAGTYKLEVTSAAGCTYSDEAVVTFLPQPVALVSGPSSIDSGDVANFALAGTPFGVVNYAVTSGTDAPILYSVVMEASGSVIIALPITTETTICLTDITVDSCTSILTSCFTIAINPNDFVNIPDANFKAKLLQASSTNLIAFNGSSYGKVDTNNDGEIQFSEALLIKTLDVSNSNIADLTGIESFTGLNNLTCSFNQLTTLNVDNGMSLMGLYCDNNNLTSINFGSASPSFFYCQNNQLTNIDGVGNLFLTTLHCYGNAISSIDLSNSFNLMELNCSNNPLTSLNVAQNTALLLLDFKLTPLTAVDLSQNINLEGLNCSFTQLTSLDLSTNSAMNNFYCQSNTALEYLNIKNGTNGEVAIENYNGTTNLQFVCADEFETEIIQLILGPEVNVNSYCSFTPGGNYNTISGLMKFDSNTDGCDASDLPQPNIKIDINDGTNQGATFTNDLGNYNFLTQTGSFTLTPDVENPSWFNFSPISATIPFTNNLNNTTTQNFCITPNGIHPDLEVVIVPIIPARPGFDAVYKIVYKNKGNQTVQGFVNFTFNDAVLDYVSASVVPNGVSGGSMNWIVPNITPFQSGSILVTLNVNSPQEVPAVNIDDVLAFNAFIDVSTDEMWDDNNFDFNQTVVGSYDPNDITCLEGNALPTIEMGKYLHYNIRFENTGTAPAENIVVKNEIDLAQYNIQSLQIMESSHPVEIRVTGNIAEFIFQSIDLDTGGHGNILLKLKSNLSLSENQVMNSADIFFDYNFPIVTNDEETVFADLSNNDFTKDLSIQVYPNPTNDIINVKAESTINSIQLYDVQGRLLSTKLLNENASTIDLSSYNVGIYFITIHTDQGIKTEKIIKK